MLDKSTRTARLFQVAPAHIEDERVSQQGILMVRAYDGRQPLALAKLGQLKLKVAGEEIALEPDEPRALTKAVLLDNEPVV